jgi:hypothetical protein
LSLEVDVIDVDANDEVVNQVNIDGSPKYIELVNKMYIKIV